ncbi:MAG: hypothetical protein JW913_11580 [Chitinispirillaceae bacterium]|nr:hypothetical protein [Chitinispirillaceae bacterium]
MNNFKHFQKVALLATGVLFTVTQAGFGALNDEIEAISSSIQGYMMNNEAKIDEEAGRLAGAYGSELIPFVQTHIREISGPALWVLLRAITKLPDKPALQDALYGMAMSEKGMWYGEVITAIYFCDPDDVVNIALRLAENTTWYDVGYTALELLKIFGNDSTITSLAQLEERINDEKFRNMVEAARQDIADRMKASEEERQDWERYALPYWRAPHEVPQLHSVVMGYFLQAESLNRRGYRFPLAFLEDRLQKNEPLAAALIAVQKEAVFIEDLKSHLSDQSIMKEVCRIGIDHITGAQTFDFTSYFNPAEVKTRPKYRLHNKLITPENGMFNIRGQRFPHSVGRYPSGIYLRTTGNGDIEPGVLNLNPAFDGKPADGP